MNLLSIIIPHHNIPTLLQRCLDSIPDDRNIQVIVVDDNSDPDIVDFEHFPGEDRKNVEVYLTQEGKGAGYARNVGLQHAKGEWLLFADADDFFTLSFYELVSRYFDSDVDMVLFKANSVDSETLEPSNRNENINRRIEACLAGKITPKEASVAVQSPWCKLIRRDFVERNKIYFDEIMASNDTMFSMKVACLATQIEICHKAIYTVTYRLGSLWNSRKNNSKNYLTRLEVQIRRNEYVQQFGFKPLPVIGYVIKSTTVSWSTFMKALWMAVSKGVLFQGIAYYIKMK